MSHTQLAKYMKPGHPKPSDQILEAFSAIFPSLSIQRLRELAGRPAGEPGPYLPPPEAARLSDRQRKAVDELIRSIVNVEALDPSEYSEWMREGVPAGISRDAWARGQRPLASVARKETRSNEPRLRNVREDSVGEENQDPGSDDPS